MCILCLCAPLKCNPCTTYNTTVPTPSVQPTPLFVSIATQLLSHLLLSAVSLFWTQLDTPTIFLACNLCNLASLPIWLWMAYENAAISLNGL